MTSPFLTLPKRSEDDKGILAYCDYIADCIRHALLDRLHHGYADIIGTVEPVKSDLHPEGGWLVSTKKTIRVTDRNGRVYRVTVEEETP